MHRGKSDPFIGLGIALSIMMFLWYVYPGFWSPVTPHFGGTCRAVPLAASAEDLVIDPSNGLVYLTYYDRVPGAGRVQSNQGSVMMLDLNAPDARVRAALATEVPGMAPSGISLYAPANGPKRLFVASLTSRGKHTVEIFEQSASGNFAHVETIRDPMIWSPVAITAVGPRQFYVGNDAWRRANNDDEENDRTREERREERRARATRPGVVYFDGERARHVAPRVNEALGLSVNRDGRLLYVTEANSSERLLIFDRDPASGQLTLRDRVQLLGVPHNLTVDTSDNVWITAHPKWIPYTRALRDASARSPTQVMKYSPTAEAGKRVTEVYMNRGEELSTGTVAAVHKDQLVIGSISDRKLLLCEQPGLSPPVFSGPEKDT
jgi:arylesterase / paraoxonase